MVHFNDINKQVKHYCAANELICSLISPPPPSNVNSILCLPNNVLESHQVNFFFLIISRFQVMIQSFFFILKVNTSLLYLTKHKLIHGSAFIVLL